MSLHALVIVLFVVAIGAHVVFWRLVRRSQRRVEDHVVAAKVRATWADVHIAHADAVHNRRLEDDRRRDEQRQGDRRKGERRRSDQP